MNQLTHNGIPSALHNCLPVGEDGYGWLCLRFDPRQDQELAILAHILLLSPLAPHGAENTGVGWKQTFRRSDVELFVAADGNRHQVSIQVRVKDFFSISTPACLASAICRNANLVV